MSGNTLKMHVESGMDTRDFSPIVRIIFQKDEEPQQEFFLPVEASRILALDLLEATVIAVNDAALGKFAREELNLSNDAIEYIMNKNRESRIKHNIGDDDSNVKITREVGA